MTISNRIDILLFAITFPPVSITEIISESHLKLQIFLNVVFICRRVRTITAGSKYACPARFRANVSTYGDTGLT